MHLKAVQQRLSFFIENVSIGGVKYLSPNYATTLGRLFWLIMLISSGAGMVFILQLTLKRFYTDVITIDVDTSFLHWDNTFPAVSICLTKGRSSSAKLKNYIKDAKIPYSSSEISFVRLIHFYMFMSPENMGFSLKNECAGLNETCGVDIELIRSEVRVIFTDFLHINGSELVI